ncbi:hypothetical protein PTH_2285 [Pelotomaculum thermopropionicum SI]|uniref:Nitrile hydratase alpha/Thiocyanate hydrolase gamma domain-containing protein n=1 Tax=Pelotomaculum thermopropionicum (strain DSM 13744 / JCM 10971 / SI) TaxID=370438 RepID=A5CZW1_PELTS|nr:hypothetical protein PTH_2285 [Pelotomaculum thermopropionicum SI]
MNQTENKPMTRREFEEQLVKKAWSDKEFKKALISAPRETLAGLGAKIPEAIEIKVVEESPKVVYLVLPVNPDELTDSQLDKVSGGFCIMETTNETCGVDLEIVCFMQLPNNF